jgi:hypothetical protein
LRVPQNNPVLQQFLYYHPGNGTTFIEVNEEKDAAKEVEALTAEVDALIEARQLSIEQLEVLGRVLFGKDTSKISTAELKRDMLIYAKRNPKQFLNALGDPMVKLQSNVHLFFDAKLLAFRSNKKEVFFNTSSNKKKILMHRTLATLFVDNPMDCKYVDHENGIKLDNRINNLRWCTQSQNTMNSKFKKGASGYKNIGAYERNGKPVWEISMMVDGERTKEYFQRETEEVPQHVIECRDQMLKDLHKDFACFRI